VCTVTRLRSGRRGVRIPKRPTDLYLLLTPKPVLRPTQHPVQWVLGFFVGSKVATAQSWRLTCI
jgi:hypothetical protein